MAASIHSLGTKYIANASFFTKNSPDAKKPANADGFLISLVNDSKWDKSIVSDLNSSQFGVYNIKSVNGYSPVGNIYFDRFFPAPSAHGIFFPEPVLEKLTAPYENTGVCTAFAMHISTLILKRHDYEKFQQPLRDCGYTETIDSTENNLYLSLPADKTAGWETFIPFSSAKDLRITSLLHTNNRDSIKIPAHQEPVDFIFPRVFWPGYTALLDGKPIQTERDASGVLVKITIPPAERESILTLSYFPITWKKLFLLPILALFLLLALLVFVKITQRQEKNPVENINP